MPAVAEIAGPHTSPELDVALVYQDAVTRVWAEEVRDLVAKVVGEEAVRWTEWKIGDLGDGGVLARSAGALARADIIVIAADEAERIPAHFYLWVNLWLELRAGLPGALVALVGTSQDARSEPSDIRGYLQAVARQGGLALFQNDRSGPITPNGGLEGELRRWAKAP